MKEDNIIKIKTQKYSIDWTYEHIHEINLKDLVGIEIHYRIDSWHVVVVESDNYQYDLDHWITPLHLVELLKELPHYKLLNISGTNSSNFLQELYKIMKWLNSEK